MRKSKDLSRNKTIEIMHSATGLSYKKCRAILKANNWDLSKAFGLDFLSTSIEQIKQIIAESLIPIIEGATEAVRVFVNALPDCYKNKF